MSCPDVDAIFEEIVCDSMADMNIFASGGAVVDQVLADTRQAVREAAEQSANQGRAPPREGGTRFSRNQSERNRALKKGEMANEFFDKVNWPEYYKKINSPEYNPDFYDDGETACMYIGGQKLTMAMQENGEFSVIRMEDENAQDDMGERDYEAGRRNSETLKLPADRNRYNHRGNRRTSRTGNRNSEQSEKLQDTEGMRKSGATVFEITHENSDAPVSQAISSAKTSIKQIPALFKNPNVTFGKTNIDIGGGRFNLATEYLAENGVENLLFDPYNQGEEVNSKTLDFLMDGNRADTATCANVLNVIAEESARANVILETAKAIKKDGTAYFMVYEGDGSGIGKETSAGYQNNRKTESYVEEIKQYFSDVQRKGKLVIATEPKNDLPKATWEVKPGEAIRFSRKVDSTGRELSAGQQAYFADSKVRDADGNLLVVYHGTDEQFTVFYVEKAGSATGANMFGDGFYFTTDKRYAKSYSSSNRIVKAYLNIENPYYAKDADAGYINRNKLLAEGYDGVAVNETTGETTYIAFFPEQIKNTDNLNPTQNKDIRYSRSSSDKWVPDLNKSQMQRLRSFVKYDITRSANSIGDTANWAFTKLDGLPVFTIYSTIYETDPTILYESKGEQAEFETQVLKNTLEDYQNGGKSTDGKSELIGRVSGGSWVRQTRSNSNSAASLGRGRNAGNASILQGTSERNTSGAFRSVIENLLKVRENGESDRVKASRRVQSMTELQEENTRLQEQLKETQKKLKNSEKWRAYWQGQTKTTAQPTLRTSDIRSNITDKVVENAS